MNDEGDIRFGELEPILGKLKQYRQLSTSMSLEWPLHNALWGFVGIKELLVVSWTYERGCCTFVSNGCS